MNTSKTVFVTGATGFIGKQLILPLKQAGFTVFALTRKITSSLSPEAHWVEGDLFDKEKIKDLLQKIKPTHLLNMAWCTTQDYQTSDLNFDFLEASLNLLKNFVNNGGKRVCFIGSCLEYASQDRALKETDPLSDTTPYACCKKILNEKAQNYCTKHNISYSYARIFYVYGPDEAPSRLTASIISRLRNQERVQIKHSQLKKDYMFTKDIARALVSLLDSQVLGSVNISSGQVVSLKDYATAIASLLGKEHLLDLLELPSSQPPIVLGDNTRLIKEVGFSASYDLKSGLREILFPER